MTRQQELQDLLAQFYRMLLESPDSVPVLVLVDNDEIRVLSPFESDTVALILTDAVTNLTAAPSAEVH